MATDTDSADKRRSSSPSKFYEAAHRNWWTDAETRVHGRDRWATVSRILRSSDLSCFLNVGFESVSSLLHHSRTLPIGRHIGIDIDVERVRQAREVNIEAYACDLSVERLPLDDETVTCVYMGEVIEHLFDPDHAVEELIRVTKKGGTIVFTTPNLGAWYNRCLLLVGIQPLTTEVSSRYNLGRVTRLLGQMNRPVGHIRLFTHRALRDFLALYSLDRVQVSGYSNDAIPFDSIFARFVSLSSGFVVQARVASNSRETTQDAIGVR